MSSTPHYDAPVKKRDKTIIDPDAPSSLEIGAIGFKEKASRRIVDVPYCHIATPAINNAFGSKNHPQEANTKPNR